MKVYDDEKRALLNLIIKTHAKRDSKLVIEQIEEKYGWVNIKVKTDDYEFSIKYSSYMTDTSELIKFFADFTTKKNGKIFVLDNEGSHPIIYIQPGCTENIRFMFAHDYNLFLKDIDYDFSQYKVECDVLVNKKEFLHNIYNIFYPYTCDYQTNSDKFVEFKPDLAQNYLKKIKKYLES